MPARPARQRLLSGSCPSARSFAPRFLPTLGRPHAVALRFVRCDQLTVGLSPTRVRPCRAHTKTPNRRGLGAEWWWPGAESNHRHADFQSAALPTELPGRLSAHCNTSRDATSGCATFGTRQVDAQLFEFAVQVRALQPAFFGHTGHGAVFLGQMELEVRLLEGVACFA